jgi:hypothetical protein
MLAAPLFGIEPFCGKPEKEKPPNWRPFKVKRRAASKNTFVNQPRLKLLNTNARVRSGYRRKPEGGISFVMFRIGTVGPFGIPHLRAVVGQSQGLRE